jgi:hypothetical protein
MTLQWPPSSLKCRCDRMPMGEKWRFWIFPLGVQCAGNPWPVGRRGHGMAPGVHRNPRLLELLPPHTCYNSPTVDDQCFASSELGLTTIHPICHLSCPHAPKIFDLLLLDCHPRCQRFLVTLILYVSGKYSHHEKLAALNTDLVEVVVWMNEQTYMSRVDRSIRSSTA